MASFGKLLSISLGIFTILSGLFASNVIRTHHENKPLGLQSLLSKNLIITLHTLDLAQVSSLASVLFVETIGPVHHDGLAILFEFIGHYTCSALGISVLTSLLIKYASVYHR